MKRILCLLISITIILGTFSGLNFVVYSDETEDASISSSFPYSDSDVYVADTIIKGIIDSEGNAQGALEFSMALQHDFTYQKLAEAMVDDSLLVFDSVFWQNLKSTLSGDFLNIANWQEEIYILLIIDYLNYYSQSAEFESNFEKNTVKFTEDIYKLVLKYANNEYLDNVDEIIKNQSLSDAVAFSEKWGIVNDINKYNSMLGNIETVSNSAIDYYKNLSKALSVQKADESRIEFLKEMKKAGSDNYYFVNAVDKVISMYESSFSTLVFNESSKTMLEYGMSVLFSEAKKACPEAAAIIDGLKIYNEGLNWLFNSDDISKNNLKLIIVYTIGSYASSAVRSLKDTYSANPTDENANAFINGYVNYLKYQQYASNNTIGFVSSALFDGIFNEIKNIFTDENITTYSEFKEYFNYDIEFCQKLEKLLEKHYDLYFAIVGYTSNILTDNNSSDNFTEVDFDDLFSDELSYNFLISGQSVITEDLNLTKDLTVLSDLQLNNGTLNLNGYTLTICGNMNQKGGKMYLNGGKLDIKGNYAMSNGNDKCHAELKMDNDSDLLNIGGDFLYSVYSNNDNSYYNYYCLSKGTIDLKGNFTQTINKGSGFTGDYDNFYCRGSNKFIFSGNDVQTVHFDSTESHFNNIELQNSNVEFVTPVKFNGWKLSQDTVINCDLSTDLGDINLNGYTLTIKGNLDLIGDGQLDINGGKLIVEGDLSQHDGTMYLNGGTLDIKGNYVMSNGNDKCYAELKMINDSDIVNIGGDFLYNVYVNNDNSYNNYYCLLKGTIDLKGNFTQTINKGSGFTGDYDNFYCRGSNKFIFSGNDVQTVHFDSTESCFNNIELQNPNVEFLTPVKFNGWKLSKDTVINCDLSTDLGNINLNGYTLTIKGDLDLIGDGQLDINGGKLIVEGGLSQHDGTMYINGGTLDIKGNYIISNGDNPCSAVLKMDNDNDIVNIGGDFLYNTYHLYDPYYEYRYLSKGTINLKGNFTQAINKGSGFTGYSNNFYSSGSNIFILSGNDVQTVHFDSTESRFGNVKLQNQNVEFLTPVKFNGWKLSQDTVINCDLSTDLGNINLNGYTLTIKGDLDLIGDGQLDINGGKLIVEGGLSQHDGTMYINGGTLDIKGNYIISNGDNPCSAVLKMDNDNDIVNIGGDFFYSTYGESYLSKGTINLKGNFTQAINKGSGFTGSSRNFYCGGSNVFILSGNDVQTVHFDSTDSKFNILKLTKDKTTGYVFEPDNCWNVLYLETNISAVSIFSPEEKIKQCGSMQISAKVVGINNPSQKVTWAISGNTDSKTSISDKGVLYVGLNEKAQQITVTATSVEDSTKSASITITIEEIVPVITGIAITPSIVSAVCGQSCQFHALVFGFYNPSQTVIWSISGNQSSNTKIDSNGLLYIANDETSKQITVKAVALTDETAVASVNVDIVQIKITSTVGNVTVTMKQGETYQLTAVVTGNNNPSQNVIWSVYGNNSVNTVINDNGQITIGGDETSSLIVVKAVSEEDPSKYGEFAINIMGDTIIGDIDSDGIITITDATQIQKYIANITEYNDEKLKVADVNKDGKISISDTTQIQKYIANIIDRLYS